MAIRTHSTTRPAGRTCSPNFRRRGRWHVLPPSAPTDAALAAIMGRIAPAEVKALHWIANNADLIIVADKTWLLTPAPKSLLEVLAAVGAEMEDMEREPDRENEHDDDGVDVDLDRGAEDEGENDGLPNPAGWEGEIAEAHYHAI